MQGKIKHLAIVIYPRGRKMFQQKNEPHRMSGPESFRVRMATLDTLCSGDAFFSIFHSVCPHYTER